MIFLQILTKRLFIIRLSIPSTEITCWGFIIQTFFLLEFITEKTELVLHNFQWGSECLMHEQNRYETGMSKISPPQIPTYILNLIHNSQKLNLKPHQ